MYDLTHVSVTEAVQKQRRCNGKAPVGFLKPVACIPGIANLSFMACNWGNLITCSGHRTGRKLLTVVIRLHGDTR
jgi:hypothetical protein